MKYRFEEGAPQGAPFRLRDAIAVVSLWAAALAV
jgi:hypothetical protein